MIEQIICLGESIISHLKVEIYGKDGPNTNYDTLGSPQGQKYNWIWICEAKLHIFLEKFILKSLYEILLKAFKCFNQHHCPGWRHLIFECLSVLILELEQIRESLDGAQAVGVGKYSAKFGCRVLISSCPLIRLVRSFEGFLAYQYFLSSEYWVLKVGLRYSRRKF